MYRYPDHFCIICLFHFCLCLLCTSALRLSCCRGSVHMYICLLHPKWCHKSAILPESPQQKKSMCMLLHSISKGWVYLHFSFLGSCMTFKYLEDNVVSIQNRLLQNLLHHLPLLRGQLVSAHKNSGHENRPFRTRHVRVFSIPVCGGRFLQSFDRFF